MNEIKLTGIPISKGIAIGKIHLLNSNKNIQDNDYQSINQTEEINRFKNVKNELINESRKLILKYNQKGKIKSILETEIMLLEDVEMSSSIVKNISAGNNCEQAVNNFFEQYSNIIESNNNTISNIKVVDINFLKNKILLKLNNIVNDYKDVENKITVASVLDSNEILKIYESGTIGFATEYGSNLSHSSIFSRSLHIPAVFGIENLLNVIKKGDTLIIDGSFGEIIINPLKKTISEYKEKQKKIQLEFNSYQELKDKSIKNKKGVKIKFYSNISNLLDLENTLSNNADGIGLVRTENLIDKVDNVFDENSQFDLYNKIAESLYPKPVTFRLFDFGYDKLSLNNEKENNPALGLRGIRYLLKNKNILEVQLNALIRASINGNLRILIPMITKIGEIEETKSIIRNISKDLEIYCPKIGTMIETPAAAYISKEICKISDFVSIGTNDLLQYFYAADRDNSLVHNYLNYSEKPFISLLSSILKNCNLANKELIICGQMASEEDSILTLVKKGFTNFSIVPSRIPLIKKSLI